MNNTNKKRHSNNLAIMLTIIVLAVATTTGGVAYAVYEINDDLFVSGNVGIGKVDPQAKLDVDGSINANNHLTHLPWFNFATLPEGPWVTGYVKLVTSIVEDEGNMFTIKITGYRYGTGGTPLEIQCGGYAYSASGLISTGCTADGTSDPVGIGVENGVVIITVGDGTSTWYFDHFTAEYVGWDQKNPDDFTWEFVYDTSPSTSNTNNVVIDDQAGNVEVKGIIKGESIILGGGTTRIIEYTGTYPETNEGITMRGDNGGWAFGIAGVRGVDGTFYGGLGAQGTDNNLDHWYIGKYQDEKVTILSDGNVGIGTTSPSEKLDVNGNLKLTGNILSDGDICIGNCS